MSKPVLLVGSIVVLTLLLYFPVARIIWILSVRRLEKKIEKEINDQDRKNQLNRARFIAVIVSFMFSCLFTYNLFKELY